MGVLNWRNFRGVEFQNGPEASKQGVKLLLNFLF